MNLAQRSVTSAAWTITTSFAKVLVLFVRTILLARWLPVEIFGIYTFAYSVVNLSVILPNFGMGGAFLHRAKESEDEQHAAAVHFTLKALFTIIWAAGLALGSLVFASGQLRVTLLVLTVAVTGIELSQTPRLILTRRVVHRRLALMGLVDVLLSTVLALGLAWKGVTLWALLATDLTSMGVSIAALYVWNPVWRPRLSWPRSSVRYFLSFGGRSFLGTLLLEALDRVDDLWTGVFLGHLALGFYSRAYTFATYPRRILAMPITTVAGGTYAELKGKRQRLSQAFFRTNAFLVRSGFLFAGVLSLVAPEFIRLALGEKWLPMLAAFRLMLVYTLFDPIKMTVAYVIGYSGAPEKVVRARLVQLAVLVIGLVTLGPRYGISGVALAVDAMLVVGIVVLLRQAREYVDFSFKRLFAVPALGLALGIGASLLVTAIPAVQGSDLRTGAIKLAMFSIAYAGTLFVLDRDSLPMLFKMLDQLRTRATS